MRWWIAAALLLLVAGCAHAQTYYEAPWRTTGWIVRTNLGTLPTTNTPAMLPFAELINEGLPQNDQKFLGTARAFDYVCDTAGNCGSTIANLILWFAPKATANIHVIFETPNPLFHLLTNVGSPVWVGNCWRPSYCVPPPNAGITGPTLPFYFSNEFPVVWNAQHPSLNNIYLSFVLPWPNNFLSGQPMEVLIDNVAGGRNRLWIVAD
jgi:hypothetical protein